MNREELLQPLEILEIELGRMNLDQVSRDIIEDYLADIRHNLCDLYNDYLDLKY